MKLNALLKTLGFLALAASPALAGTPAPKQPLAPLAPENDDLGINLSFGYDTSYIWRGLNFGNHWVRSAIDGSILLVAGNGEDGAGTTSLLWDVQFGTFAGDQDHFTPNPGGGIANGFFDASFQRLQLGAVIEHDLGPVSIFGGYRYYRNMGDLSQELVPGLGINGINNNAQEVTAGISADVGPLTIRSSANYDFVNDYWYFDFNAKATFAITESFAIEPFFDVGYGKNINWQFQTPSLVNFNTSNTTGWTAIFTGVRFPIKLNSRAMLIPYVGANLTLSGVQNRGGQNLGGIVGLPDTPYQSVLVGGVTLTVSF